MPSGIPCFVSDSQPLTGKRTIFVVLCTEKGRVGLFSGTREFGETDEQTMCREMEEECKIPRAKLKRWLARNDSGNAQFIKFQGSKGGISKIFMAFLSWDKQHAFMAKYKWLVENAYHDHSLPLQKREIETIGIYDLSMLQLIPNRSDYLRDVTSLLQKEIPKFAISFMPNIVNVPIPAHGYAPVPAHGYAPVPAHGYAPVPAHGYAPVPAHSHTHTLSDCGVGGCRIPGCGRHNCWICGAIDMHLSKNCPMNPNQECCKVQTCDVCPRDRSHYCWKCGDRDANHRSAECPFNLNLNLNHNQH